MSQAASRRQVVRVAGLIAALSLLSKPINFLKDIVVAAAFGTTAAKDAFLVAWTLPDLISGLITEGLSGVLVPIFAEYAGRQEGERAWRIASSVANAIVLLLSAAAVVVILAAPLLVRLLAPAFPPDTHALAVSLTRLLAVSMVFMALQGLITSVLNAHQRFVAPALAPVASSIVIIVVVLLTGARWGIDALAFGAVLGALAMIVVQLPRLPWRELRYYRGIDRRDEGTQRFVRLMIPLIAGTLILSSTNVVNRIFGSLLPEGSLAALDFALRTTGPAYIIAPALATVLLPTLARQAALGQWDDFRDRLALGVKMHLLVTIPAALGFIILAEPITRLLFQRGAFDARSTALTSGALAWYALGLASYGLYYLLINVFYALQNTTIRIRAGLVLVGTYIAGNLLLIGPLQANGIALSYGLAHTAACLVLLARLGQRLGWRVEGALAGFALRVLAAAALMALAIGALRTGLGDAMWAGDALDVLAALLVTGGAAIVVYLTALWLLGVSEVRRLPALLRREG